MSLLRVAHSFEVWLPPTMTWAYNQVRYAEGTEGAIVARKTANLDQFPWSPLLTCNTALERVWLKVAQRARTNTYSRSCLRALRKVDTAILHSHMGYRGWEDLPLARKLVCPHVVTFYGHDATAFPLMWPIWRRRYADLFAAADLILCEGPYFAGSLRELGCPEDKVAVQRLGVEVDRLPYAPRTVGPDGIVRVLVASAFRPKKGIPSALQAVAAARKAGHDVRVTLLGSSNGSEAEEMEQKAIEEAIVACRLGDVVDAPGMITHARFVDELARHHILLAPSRMSADGDAEGGAPVTIMEAAATGMPVMSTTHCDIPEVVEDGVTGVLAPEDDQEALNACFERLLASSELWPAMGEAAAALIRRKFDVRMCAAELVERYRSLVGAPVV